MLLFWMSHPLTQTLILSIHGAIWKKVLDIVHQKYLNKHTLIEPLELFIEIIHSNNTF